MDIISLYYFSELAKDLHMTRTANRLFISQQTLSNHIQRLEEYYGVQLLNRKPSLTLTPAGEYVLAFANIVNAEEANLKDILFDVEKQERGTIRFGGSSLRVNACLPSILPKFTERYPQVDVRIVDDISRRLRPMILEGTLDCAMVISSAHEDPKIIADPLMEDQTFVCVRDDLLHRYYGDATDRLKRKAVNGVKVSDLCRIPFTLLTNGMGTDIQENYEQEAVKPIIYASSSDTRIGLNLCSRGLCGCFVPQLRLVSQMDNLPKDLNIFPLVKLTGEPVTQSFCLIHHKDRYVSTYSHYFMDMLFEYFGKVEKIHMERIARK